MGNKDFIKKLLAGIFFVLCLVVAGTTVFVLGVEKGLTEPKFQMTALFRKVGGLTIGAPVRLSGVTVGTVADIDFLNGEVDGRSVRTKLNLFKKYEAQLHKATRFAIITEGVLGEKVIEITTEPAFLRQDLTQSIIGEDPLDVQNLAESFGNAAVSLKDASKGMDSIIEEVKDISSATKRVLNRIEQRIIEGNLFKVF
jgi:phospholipid/cholesterol/gamma-HCH transport system substrate-binding protein